MLFRSVPTAVNDDVSAASPGADHQDDLSYELLRPPEVNGVRDPATFSVLQPFICSSVSRPYWKSGVVVVSIRYYQVIEMSRNPRTVPQTTCQSVIEGDSLFPGPIC